MSFSDDMRAMTSDDVKNAVITRLRNHEGVPWNESQGEPVWALLQSAFQYWREDDGRLAAVDSALSELAHDAFTHNSWRLFADVCEYAAALALGQPAWLAPSIHRWPFDQWLQAPLSPPEKMEASISAYQLMRMADKADRHWIASTFAAARKQLNNDTGQTLWFIECWKAVVSISPGGKRCAFNIPLFDAFSAVRQLSPENQQRVIETIVAWAWLLLEATERDGLAEVVLKTIGDFDDENFSALLYQGAQQELPDTPKMNECLELMGNQLKAENSNSVAVEHWLRHPPQLGTQQYRKTMSCHQICA